MTTQPLDTAAIQARCDAATDGPWEAFDTDQHWSLHMEGFPMQILKAPKQGTPYAEYWPNAADAAFIVHARTDVPALLARIADLETKRTALEAACDGLAEAGRNESRIWAARVAELEQQLARLAKDYTAEERLHAQTIAERDSALTMADRLAAALAPADVIGEHSDGNDPWQNALDYAAPSAAPGAR